MRVDGYKYIFCGMINQIDCWDQLVLIAAIFLAEVCQGTTGVRLPLNNLLKGPRILARSHEQNKTKQGLSRHDWCEVARSPGKCCSSRSPV